MLVLIISQRYIVHVVLNLVSYCQTLFSHRGVITCSMRSAIQQVITPLHENRVWQCETSFEPICCYSAITDGSNDLISFLMWTECKDNGQKSSYKETKNKGIEHFYTVCISEGQNKKFININNNNLLPSIAKFSPGNRKHGINKFQLI